MINAVQSTSGGGEDLVLISLPTSGGLPIFSTYFGGSGDEEPNSLVLDASGAPIFGGVTQSTDFPIKSSIQSSAGGNGDAFITKLTADGSSLVSSTYLGGVGSDGVTTMVMDVNDGSLVAGGFAADDFPTNNSMQPFAGGGDAFLLKLDSSLSTLIYSSYVGGSSSDYLQAIALSKSGEVFLGGGTQSTDFPTVNALFPTYQGEYGAAFVAKVNAAGSALEFSTFLPGQVSQGVSGIAVDADDAPYFVGVTESSNFPTFDPVMSPTVGGDMGFLTVLTPGGSQLVMSTLFGSSSSGDCWFSAVDVDTMKRSTIVGWTLGASGIATPGAFQTTYPGSSGQFNGIVAQIAGFPLAIEPSDVDLPPRGASSFVGAGGQGAYHFAISTNSSGATIDSSTGAYTAGANGNVADVVRVTDDSGAFREGFVHVGNVIAVTPSLAHAAPRASVTLAASGGSGSNYVWSMLSNASGGTIDANGIYTAGAIGSVTDRVDVKDQLGNHGSASIAVTAAISISPTNDTIAPLATEAFSATGGATGYVWSLASNASGGAIDPKTGVYKAGATTKVQDEIAVADVLGNTATTRMFVGSGLDIEPKEPTIDRNTVIHFTTIGGTEEGITFSLVKNPSGATITSDGVYVSGSFGGTTDTIQVVDSVGNRSTTDIHVYESGALEGAGAGCSCREVPTDREHPSRESIVCAVAILALFRSRRSRDRICGR